VTLSHNKLYYGLNSILLSEKTVLKKMNTQ